MSAIKGTSTDGTAAVSGENSATIPTPPGNVWPAAGVSGTSDKNGIGVIGFSDSGIGLWGHSNSSTGTGGVSETGIGVQGISNKGNSGVRGDSPTGVGVQGNSTSGRGVEGNSQSWQGVYGSSQTNAGVVGEAAKFHGVFGVSHDSNSAGVFGTNNAPGGMAGLFDGDLAVTGNVLLSGGDCAEQFEVTDPQSDPGTVMVFDDCERLSACSQSYDRRVAGVISGAGQYRPGLVLNGRERADNGRPIALVGRVYCKVDASFGPVQTGDLLTTSSNRGYAMKAQDASQAFGATLGKALRSLSEGQGLIPVLVALQ